MLETNENTCCLVCGSPNLKQVGEINAPLVSTFPASREECGQIKSVPLIFDMCQFCHLVQQRYTTPQELLYTKQYWYKSGTTELMRRQLKDVVYYCTEICPLKERDIVLDIGANDGTLLSMYDSHILRVGVEPATNLIEQCQKHCDIVIEDFWGGSQYAAAVGYGTDSSKAKIITALGMFYDLPNPGQFIRDVAKALHPEGIFVAQLMCLKNMLNQMDVGNLCHEHLEFYSLYSLRFLFATNGLQIVDISKNATNGESYRITAVPSDSAKCQRSGRVIQAMEEEKNLKEDVTRFFSEIHQNKEELRSFLIQESLKGKRIWVLGASTKGNTLLQHYGLDYRVIEAAADRDPSKHGKYTITGIPIKSETEFRDANPDYALILPYAFKDEIIQRERHWWDLGQGSRKFVIPLPKLEII